MLAQKKAETAAMKDANKLQNNKREMVKNMTLILSDSFQHAHADLLPSLKERFRELRGTILFGRQLLRDHHTIQWKMRSNKRYNAETRNWIPCEEHEVLQSTALLYITGANLVHLVRTPMLVQDSEGFSQRLRQPVEPSSDFYHGRTPGEGEATQRRPPGLGKFEYHLPHSPRLC